jgi:sec-independent protein translocase protein TatA
MLLGLQPVHLVIILAVALILFGPKQLPELGRGFGKAISEFKKATQESTEPIRKAVESTASDDQSK